MLRTLLYMEMQGLSQSATVRRMRGAAYLYVRFGHPRPPTQQIISHTKHNRLEGDYHILTRAAEEINKVCAEHDVVDAGEPALHPEDLDPDRGVGEEKIREAVEIATELGFGEFVDPRASNSKYALEAYFERQRYLNMARAGTTTKRRRFARLSDRDEVPHGSSHNRTMKKVADPDTQLTFGEFSAGEFAPEWQRVRDAVLPAFHAGVEKQLDEIAGRDRHGIRQPVMAALDITTFNFWPSPYKSSEDVSADEEPVEVNGREVYPKDDFPEMVSGFKKSGKKKHERGYKFATLTIVAEDTPIVLAIEPVRDYRGWKRPDREEVDTSSRAEIVERLLNQAEQHVDIHKVFCDHEFDAHEVRDVIDRRDIRYVIGKRRQSAAGYENIEEIIDDPVYDSRIEYVELTYDARTHDVSIIYLPGDEFSLFTVNEWVDPDRTQALTDQYRHRWEIENEYKTIKKHFLPTSATKDYRIRFLYFVIGVMMYNIWRLTNFLLRDELDVDLGDDPPILAGEIVELVGFYFFDPGD